MVKSQENGTTIPLGLKGYEVGKVSEEEKGIVVEVATELKKPASPRCDSAKLYRRGRAKKRKVHFDNETTNGFTEGCNTKIEMLERASFGLRNVEVYWRKMLLGFTPSRSYFHTV